MNNIDLLKKEVTIPVLCSSPSVFKMSDIDSNIDTKSVENDNINDNTNTIPPKLDIFNPFINKLKLNSQKINNKLKLKNIELPGFKIKIKFDNIIDKESKPVEKSIYKYRVVFNYNPVLPAAILTKNRTPDYYYF